MRKWIGIAGVVLSLGLFAWQQAERRDRTERAAESALDIVERYGSAPKGVILEDNLNGLPPISHVEYDKRANRFTLNRGAFTYALPVQRADFITICNSLAQQKQIGVSIKKDKSFFTYGSLPAGSAVGRDLAEADRILGGTVFAIPEFIQGVRLPRNYRPKAVNNRKIWSVATFKFHGFTLSAVPGRNEFARAGFLFTPQIIPVEQFKRARDGGFVPNHDFLRRGILGEPEDIENLNFIQGNQNDFFAMPAIARAINLAEATAFARSLQDAGFNLNEVAAGLR